LKKRNSCYDEPYQAPKGIGMKKALVVIMVIVLGISGFLYYDWHTKTKKQASEPSIPQYSWTDAQGTRHFTDRQSIDPPLVVTIKKKGVEYYKKIKARLFKPKKEKGRKK
jgi:hypothetical protein